MKTAAKRTTDLSRHYPTATLDNEAVTPPGNSQTPMATCRHCRHWCGTRSGAGWCVVTRPAVGRDAYTLSEWGSNAFSALARTLETPPETPPAREKRQPNQEDTTKKGTVPDIQTDVISETLRIKVSDSYIARSANRVHPAKAAETQANSTLCGDSDSVFEVFPEPPAQDDGLVVLVASVASYPDKSLQERPHGDLSEKDTTDTTNTTSHTTCGVCVHFTEGRDGLGTCSMHGRLVSSQSSPATLACGEFQAEEVQA